MTSLAHVLIVRAGGVPWAFPMDAVEQTFEVDRYPTRSLGASGRVVNFRGDTLELHDLAQCAGVPGAAEPAAAVVAWAAGRRRAFLVEALVGQYRLERVDVPAVAHGPLVSGLVFAEAGDVVPVVEPGALVGAWTVGGESALGYSDMERSALLEVANIGASHAATALSSLLGRPIEITYTEALLATLAEAADRAGAAAATSAVVDTPVKDDGGRVLLLFPEDAAADLCALLGSSLDDDLGRSTLREVGNILATSYLNAVVEMTGLELEPDPPAFEVDVLGTLMQRSLAGSADPSDPTILMRSQLIVEAADASFSFLFVPHIKAVEALLSHLGLGSAA
jgi:chemotaxis protein CheC